MHFVNVFLNSSCPHIFAQGVVSIIIQCLGPQYCDVYAPRPSAVTFCIHSTVCQSVQTDAVRKIKHDFAFSFENDIQKMLMIKSQ